jgi:transposase-like protein
MDPRSPHHPRWQPPFCPNPKCSHHSGLKEGWRYKRIGFFRRFVAPRRIQRFICLDCGRSFSCQTFSPDYWLKRPDILPKLMTKTTGCMANRQIARDLHVAPSTVDRQIDRLGRHCLLFHKQLTENMPPPGDITIDGFESFELSQYFPFHHHVAVDNTTGLFLGFTDSPLRRKGRMTDYQKQRRSELEALYGRPDPKAVLKDMRELLEMVTKKAKQITIRSDDHRSYPRAMLNLPCDVDHRVTSSRVRRDRHNELWEVNLLDLVIRHSSGNHKRETIAWSKRRQGSSLRLAVFMVWRNCVKKRWEKRCRKTPAMEAGLCDRALTAKEILVERLFPTRTKLSGRWRDYYYGEVQTPALGVNRKHELTYAT